MSAPIATPAPGSSDALAWDADEAVTALYAAHYAGLVRIAALVLHDVAGAEEVVQDAFVAMHGRWHRLREPDKAVAYLRRSVINGGRSVLRRRAVANRKLPRMLDRGDAESPEQSVIAAADRSGVLAHLGRLPRRQREVLVLRYYAELSEAEIAATLGISRGAVKSHASRGMSALRAAITSEVAS